MRALLIAEKPDLMRKIQSVYEKYKNMIPYDITFASQRGHLVKLCDPAELCEDLKTWKWDTLPIVPSELGGWKYKVIKEKKQGNFKPAQEIYKSICEELKKPYDFVIHAGDPDQEGELLVRLVLSLAGNTLPVKRFWTNDLTEKHILNALLNLRDDDSDPMLKNLLAAAYARQHSDWMYGMNGSRAASLKMHEQVSLGRVKTPLLAIVCKREEEIANFVPHSEYGVRVNVTDGFSGVLYDVSADETDEKENEKEQKGVVWFETKEEAEAIIRTLPNDGTVTSYRKERTEKQPPKMYKLATLQIDAGKKGYNDSDALAALQALYEAGYTTYPRTDTECLSSDEDYKGLLLAISSIEELRAYTERVSDQDINKVKRSKKWVNDALLAESGHSALRPTEKIPDLNSLSQIQKDIYMMVAKRFAAIFMPPLVTDKTTVLMQFGESIFRANGKIVVSKGYAELFDSEIEEEKLPLYPEGAEIIAERFEATQKTSSCPKRYTSPELIAVCENPLKFLNDARLKELGKRLKIGTPATRSAIIRQLIDKDGYLIEKKVPKSKQVQLAPSEIGKKIVKSLDGLQICRVDMTGIWEEGLEAIRSGEKTKDDFEEEIIRNISAMITEIHNRNIGSEVAKCPKCGAAVLEGKKVFYCSDYKNGCDITLFKKDLSGTQTFTIEDYLIIAGGGELEKGRMHYRYNLETKKLEASYSVPCPLCGGPFVDEGYTYVCSCGMRIQKVMLGHTMTENDITAMKDGGTTALLSLKKKNGEAFKAKLQIDANDKKVIFAKAKDADEERVATDLPCPHCGASMTRTSLHLFCSECDSSMLRKYSGHEITKQDLISLRRDNVTDTISDFVSAKSGKMFAAKLKIGEDRRFEFIFDQGKESSFLCPLCGKRMREKEKGTFCECGMKIWKSYKGHEITEEDVKALAGAGKTNLLTDFISSGMLFSGFLTLNQKKKEIKVEKA